MTSDGYGLTSPDKKAAPSGSGFFCDLHFLVLSAHAALDGNLKFFPEKTGLYVILI
jgi:hypothetical protein